MSSNYMVGITIELMMLLIGKFKYHNVSKLSILLQLSVKRKNEKLDSNCNIVLLHGQYLESHVYIISIDSIDLILYSDSRYYSPLPLFLPIFISLLLLQSIGNVAVVTIGRAINRTVIRAQIFADFFSDSVFSNQPLIFDQKTCERSPDAGGVRYVGLLHPIIHVIYILYQYCSPK